MKFTLPVGNSFKLLSAADDNTSWAVTVNDTMYVTSNAGAGFKKINPPFFTGTQGIQAVAAISGSSAIICVGGVLSVSPGVYKTTDTGKTWKKVLQAKWSASFLISMSSEKTGLLVYNSSNDGSRSVLYRTLNGGNTWDSIPMPNGSGVFTSISLKRNKAWLIDYNNFYYSSNLGASWITETLPDSTKDSWHNHLCMESDDYGIFNSSQATDLYVKRPGTNSWQHSGDPTGNSFLIALECMVLNDDLCMFAAPQDVPFNYYSSDSAKTFNRLIIQRNPPVAFKLLEKSRTGKNIWAATMNSIWVFEKKQTFTENRNNQNIKQSVAPIIAYE